MRVVFGLRLGVVLVRLGPSALGPRLFAAMLAVFVAAWFSWRLAAGLAAIHDVVTAGRWWQRVQAGQRLVHRVGESLVRSSVQFLAMLIAIGAFFLPSGVAGPTGFIFERIPHGGERHLRHGVGHR